MQSLPAIIIFCPGFKKSSKIFAIGKTLVANAVPMHVNRHIEYAPTTKLTRYYTRWITHNVHCGPGDASTGLLYVHINVVLWEKYGDLSLKDIQNK